MMTCSGKDCDHPRYHVVTVSKYIGMYRAKDPTAYAVADHDQANRVVSEKYDSLDAAEQEARRLNEHPDTFTTTEHCQYCGNTWAQTRTIGTPRLDAVPCPACKRLV